MTGFLWIAVAFLGGLGVTALGDMASQEIRDRLDHLPNAVLRLAARRLSPAQRITIYEEEWLPELTYILKGAEARPVTRLITGTHYAIGILLSAPRIARQLHRAHQPAQQEIPLDKQDWLANLADDDGPLWGGEDSPPGWESPGFGSARPPHARAEAPDPLREVRNQLLQMGAETKTRIFRHTPQRPSSQTPGASSGT